MSLRTNKICGRASKIYFEYLILNNLYYCKKKSIYDSCALSIDKKKYLYCQETEYFRHKNLNIGNDIKMKMNND